ncbi:MAG TPA: 3-deoxy-8-phosphooctulonate synthase [Myxococcota bacterium]|nr:3-deoxy-8-phosphooctulonate synthase [Myxococcota bacterium]
MRVGNIELGEDLVLIAGPCVIESRDSCLRLAEGLAELCAELDLPLIFKASFDKANRSSGQSFRGPGLEEGLRILEEVPLPVTTDVHLPDQAAAVAEVADLLQVPAFLCRQTDLLVACGRTGKPVNVKKGQFVAPWDMRGAVEKVGGPVMLTERGSSFGYNRLVTDMTSLVHMRALGVPVCMDATHAVQEPGAFGIASGGQREMAPAIARAAVAVGIDALFLEVHEDPPTARSDAATQLPLSGLREVLEPILAIDRVLRQGSAPG